MRHEKIIKRENGIQHKISVTAFLDSYISESLKLTIEVCYREKGKKHGGLFLAIFQTMH